MNLNNLLTKERFIFDKFKFSDLFYLDYCDRKSLYELISKKLSLYVSGDVLDFGCGCMPYKDCFSYNTYLGIDTENSGHWRDGRTVNTDIITYDGGKLPFENNSFDTIFSSNVFEHVMDLDQSIKEIYRCLRKNGLLVITMPMAEEEHETPYDFRRFTEYGIQNFFLENGFRTIESGKINSYKNSMNILNLSYIFSEECCLPKLLKLVYLLQINFSRLISGNKRTDSKFSNKIFCIGEKIE